MYEVDVWDYSKDEESLEKLIKILRDTKRVIVMYDKDFPKGRGVFYFGPESDINLEEANIVNKSLNTFHYGKEV